MHSTQFHRSARRAAAPVQQRAAQAIEQFKRWYSATGHWVYDGRADAARTWITRGITTLPQAPAGADALLADWVAADTLPALIARLRADEAASRVATESAHCVGVAFTLTDPRARRAAQ